MSQVPYEQYKNIIVPQKNINKSFAKFLIFSIIGVAFFLIPLYWNGNWTIGIGILVDIVKKIPLFNNPQTNQILTINDTFAIISLILVVASAIITWSAVIFKPDFIKNNKSLARIFLVSWIWLLLRTIGAIFIIIIYFEIKFDWLIYTFQNNDFLINSIQLKSEWINSIDTGSFILKNLNATLIPFFFFAIILLPFLVDYGLMEYIGTILSKPFKILFNLPGHAAIDVGASWLGTAPVGVLITSQQYEKGFYNQREASIIATNFSLASAAFCLVIAKTIGIENLFIQFYLTIVVVGIVAAIIVSHLPPIIFKRKTYNNVDVLLTKEAYPQGESMNKWATKRAIARAYRSPNLFQSLKGSFYVLGDVYLGLMPVVFAIGTIVLALSEYTTIFSYLSKPLIPYLEWLQIPEAVKAAPAMLVGFADIFLPAILGKDIESEMTKFIIACISVLQIIYMTEVGALILKSKIKLNIIELFIIFIMRTLICLPLVVLIANYLVFNN